MLVATDSENPVSAITTGTHDYDAHDMSRRVVTKPIMIEDDVSLGTHAVPAPADGRYDGNGLTRVKLKACPSCGSFEFESIGKDGIGFREVIGGKEFVQSEYVIRECTFCGLMYRDTILADTDIEDYYRQADFRNWEIDAFYPTERAALSMLLEIPRGGHILDFGCSSGRLLSALIASHNCYGCEANAEAAAQAAAKGLTIVPFDSLDTDWQQKFDAIVLVDVFEHLQKPLIVLQKLFALLRNGGFLLIVSGNGDCSACRIEPAQFWYFRSVQHIAMLTKRHSLFLQDKLGGTLERWQELTHYDTPFVDRLFQWGRHFSYWQFRKNTFLARTLLFLVPLLRQAQHWKSAPALTCSRDHVMVVFRKT